MRVFVCSPLRGADGLPSERNIALARKLMRAVFDAGHQPFVPHLLYPQVLSESPADLGRAFKANYAWLDVSDESWVYAREFEECSSGMQLEVTYCLSQPKPALAPVVVWMPPPFAEVEAAMKQYDGLNTVALGECTRCATVNALNRAGICMPCFAAGTLTR